MDQSQQQLQNVYQQQLRQQQQSQIYGNYTGQNVNNSQPQQQQPPQQQHQTPQQFITITSNADIQQLQQQPQHPLPVLLPQIPPAIQRQQLMLQQPAPIPPLLQYVAHQNTMPQSLSLSISALSQTVQQPPGHVMGLYGGATSTNDGCNLGVNSKNAKDSITEEFRKDFEDFKKMNLVDDDDLHKIYDFEDSFSDPGVVCSLLFRLYQQKYKWLYSKYAGLEFFTIFVLMGIISKKSFAEFKSMLRNSSVVNNVFPGCKSTMSQYGMFKYKHRGGKLADGGPASAGRLPYKRRCNVGAMGKTEVMHELLNTPFFKNNRMLFYLGEIHKVLMPIEFTAIKASLSVGQVKLYGAMDRTTTGVIMELKVPTLLRVVVQPNYIHYIEDTDHLLAFVNAGLNKKVDRTRCTWKKEQKTTVLCSGHLIDINSCDVETLYTVTLNVS